MDKPIPEAVRALIAELDEYLRGCPNPETTWPVWMIRKPSRLLWRCREAICTLTTAAQQQGQAVGELDMHTANGILCDFGIRWKLDGDYLRCRGCDRPQLTSYADHPFPHAADCKHAPTSESHPWRIFAALLAPLIPSTAPPSAPVGAIRKAKIALLAGSFDSQDRDCIDKAIAYLDEALAQQPAAVDELIERLNRCADDCDIYSPDQCATLIDGIGHLAMRHLLREAAAALEAAREDGARLDWLERHCVNVADEYGTGSQLYLGTYATGQLRAAIDQARGKAGQEVGK